MCLAENLLMFDSKAAYKQKIILDIIILFKKIYLLKVAVFIYDFVNE